MKKGQIIALVVIAVILLIIIVLVAKNLQTTSTATGGGSTTTTTAGLGDIFAGVLNWFKPKSTPVVQCDPAKPGYDMDGFPNVDCGFGG